MKLLDFTWKLLDFTSVHFLHEYVRSTTATIHMAKLILGSMHYLMEALRNNLCDQIWDKDYAIVAVLWLNLKMYKTGKERSKAPNSSDALWTCKNL